MNTPLLVGLRAEKLAPRCGDSTCHASSLTYSSLTKYSLIAIYLLLSLLLLLLLLLHFLLQAMYKIGFHKKKSGEKNGVVFFTQI